MSTLNLGIDVNNQTLALFENGSLVFLFIMACLAVHLIIAQPNVKFSYVAMMFGVSLAAFCVVNIIRIYVPGPCAECSDKEKVISDLTQTLNHLNYQIDIYKKASIAFSVAVKAQVVEISARPSGAAFNNISVSSNRGDGKKDDCRSQDKNQEQDEWIFVEGGKADGCSFYIRTGLKSD